MTASYDVAIVGGGASGTLLAVQLLRLARGPLSIALIERASVVGRGVAYSTPCAAHRLNVPAAKMGAFPDDVTHFHRWLQREVDPAIAPGDFVPRGHYARYLRALLTAATSEAPPDCQLEIVHDEAIAHAPRGLLLASGQTIVARRVVLALGNFPPGVPGGLPYGITASPHFILDPWAPGALDDLPADEPLLLIGTGLTAVDVVLALREAGHRGRLHLLSRHGLLPQVHRVSEPQESPDWTGVTTALGLFERLRAAVAASGDWRAVIDSLRAQTQSLWLALGDGERRRFIRHLRAYWDVHRHRVAPEIAMAFEAEVDRGAAVVHAGRLRDAEASESGLSVAIARRHGSTATLAVARAINCTGPASNYHRIDHPLVVDLLERGLIRPDALAMGLDTADHGALVDASGETHADLFTLGPPRRGTLWESVAVPEIRAQAAELARALLATEASARAEHRG